MAVPVWIEKLKKRWQLNSIKQVLIVLVVFGLTGCTILLLKKPLLALIPEASRDHWVFSLLYFIFIFPIYNLFLLFYGFLFGQFFFFWEFEKKTFRKIITKFKNKP